MQVTCTSCSRPNQLPAARLQDKARCAACKSPLLPLDRPLDIGSAAEFDELVKNAKTPVLVDFWAAWCGPCRIVAPELAKVASSHAGRAVVAKIDTDAQPELSARFGINSIPTMIVFRNGREAQRLSGAMPAGTIVARAGL